MTFEEVLFETEEIRRQCKCRDSAPNFKYKQGFYDGKKFRYYRHRTVELELYPDNNRHFQILKDIHSFGFDYAGILHDSDLLEKEVEEGTDDSGNKEVGGEENFEDLDFGDEIPDNENIILAEKKIITDSNTFDYDEVIVDDKSKFSLDGIHKKPHFHIVMHFSNARTNTAIAKVLQHDSNLTWVYSNLDARLLYLTHRDYVWKYQYSPNRVFGPLAVRMPQLHTEYGRRSSDLLKDVISKINNAPKESFIRFSQLASDLLNTGYDSLLTSRYLGVVKECIYEHNNFAKWIHEKGYKSYRDDQMAELGNPFIEI